MYHHDDIQKVIAPGIAMQPLYTPENTTAAYQLNWTVAVFGLTDLPSSDLWLSDLTAAAESDGVRILEYYSAASNVAQFLVSTRPHVSPSQVVRSVKGRFQYLIRSRQPKAFRRNYSIASVGEVNSRVLEKYLARQLEKHPMADVRVQQRLSEFQFEAVGADQNKERIGNFGRFIHNLQVVLENECGWNEIRPEFLMRSRQMIIDSASKHSWNLSRIGILSNHIHILLSADVTESPESVALSLMNNLAFVQGMKPVLRFSYYCGTFGEFDRNAIRRKLHGE